MLRRINSGAAICRLDVYALRRRLKKMLGLGVSAASSTWAEIQEEATAAGLHVERAMFIAPLLSEDVVPVLTKRPVNE